MKASRGLPSETESQAVVDRLFEEDNRRRCMVAVLDIRRSTQLMLHLEDFAGYAARLAAYMSFVRNVTHRTGGWFDKFTGDGALVFWELDPPARGPLALAVGALISFQWNFVQGFAKQLRAVAGRIPSDYGLAVGADYGECMLTDLTPADMAFEENGKLRTVSSQPVLETVTVLGKPVVGAARLAQEAPAHQILMNQTLQHLLQQLSPNLAVEAKSVLTHIQNRDIGGQQVAYRLEARSLQLARKKLWRAD